MLCLIFMPSALGASGIHIRQSTRAHVITYTYILICTFINTQLVDFGGSQKPVIDSSNSVQLWQIVDPF